MFAELSFLGSPTVCFMQCGVISYMFWLCYMMFAIRIVGQKTVNSTLKRDCANKTSRSPLART